MASCNMTIKVIIVGVPVIAILQDVSPNGRFVGLSLLISTFPLSCMGLILVPKMLMVRRDRLGGVREKRGSKQRVRVSGMTDDNAARRSSEMKGSENPRFSGVQTVTIQ